MGAQSALVNSPDAVVQAAGEWFAYGIETETVMTLTILVIWYTVGVCVQAISSILAQPAERLSAKDVLLSAWLGPLPILGAI